MRPRMNATGYKCVSELISIINKLSAFYASQDEYFKKLQGDGDGILLANVLDVLFEESEPFRRWVNNRQ